MNEQRLRFVPPSLRRERHTPPPAGHAVDHADGGQEDSLLIAAVAGGSEDALRQLYERYGGLVYTVALRMVGDRDIAQEVVQDVFLRCWDRAASFTSERGRVHAWLMAITRNRAIDVLRGAQHHARQRDRELLPGDYGRPVLTHADHGDAVALQLTVSEALQTLPDGQRRALELALLGELTQREIAQVMAIPLGTVKTRIRDGMARLRVELLTGARSSAARKAGVADA